MTTQWIQTGAVDNSRVVSSFLDSNDDGDTFWYTEIIDRTKSSAGDNRRRTIRMFHHKCRDHLLETMTLIRALCDATGARAMTRLSPRSRKSVGKMLLSLSAEMAVGEAWDSAPYLYARACGRSSIHGRKLWLYDIDDGQDPDGILERHLVSSGWLRGVVRSRSGKHYISLPHDPRNDPIGSIQLHKDNPTNLYIPANSEQVEL